MTPFFRTPDRVSALQSVAKSWCGTPFYPHGTRKGEGVSCQTLGAEIYRELGLSVPSLPRLSLRTFRANRKSAIAVFIDIGCPFLKPAETIEPGDLLLFEMPACEHMGVALTVSSFVHANLGGVSISRMDPAFSDALTRIWRPHEAV